MLELDARLPLRTVDLINYQPLISSTTKCIELIGKGIKGQAQAQAETETETETQRERDLYGSHIGFLINEGGCKDFLRSSL